MDILEIGLDVAEAAFEDNLYPETREMKKAGLISAVLMFLVIMILVLPSVQS